MFKNLCGLMVMVGVLVACGDDDGGSRELQRDDPRCRDICEGTMDCHGNEFSECVASCETSLSGLPPLCQNCIVAQAGAPVCDFILSDLDQCDRYCVE